MNCPTGKPGTPAYAMSAEESLSNMARLSLCGKLNLAIEKCNLYLPFWIIDSTVQRIVLAIGLSIMVYAGKLWLMEQAEK